MRKILNHICIAAIGVSAAFLMTACVKDYGRDDVKKYIYEELGIKNISLSKEPEDVYDGEFHDKLWTVTDKDNDVDFHVLDDRTWGMESASNSLKNDYYDEYFLKFYEDANIKSKYVEILREEDELTSVRLTAVYSNLDELDKIYNELKDYYDFFMEKRANIEIVYNIDYDFPLRHIGNNDIEMADTFDALKPADFNKSVYNRALKEYYELNLAYYFEDNLKGADNKILKEIIDDKNTYRIAKYSGENIELIYDDIIAHPYAYGITFGTMYKIFEKEGFPLTGNPYHYTVTAPNGDVYEFSYEFNDMAYPEEESEDGFYYYKNGEKTPMQYPCYCYFRCDAIKEMFGLDLDDGKIAWLTK